MIAAETAAAVPSKGDSAARPNDTKRGSKLHDLVYDGTMTLRSVQRQIAANWQALSKKVFGVAPR